MATDERWLGFDSIAFGAAFVATAGMPTSGYTSLVSIVPDSARLVMEPPVTTEFMVEDSDDADMTIRTAGAKYFEFSTYDMDVQNWFFGFGGTTTSTLWKSPTGSSGIVEHSVRGFTKSVGGRRMRIDAVRVSISAGLGGDMSKSKPGQIDFRGDVLRPYQTTDTSIVRADVAG